MKKGKVRIKKLKLVIFIIIILGILFAFNIFGIRDKVFGNKVEKTTEGDYDITTTEGNNILLPQVFSDENIQIIETGKITEYKKEENKATKHNIHTIDVKCQKTKQEITDYYKTLYPSSMTLQNEEEHNILIAGSANNLVKFLINENEYKVVIEQK